jgi:hypothetical protein
MCTVFTESPQLRDYSFCSWSNSQLSNSHSVAPAERAARSEQSFFCDIRHASPACTLWKQSPREEKGR